MSNASVAIEQGMTDDPCAGLCPAIPDEALAYIRVLMTLRLGDEAPPPPAALLDFTAANAAARAQDWPDLCRYRADNARLAAGPAAGRDVVFIGDSITQLWGVCDPDFFGHGVVNRGISGQTTPQMLLRFMSDVVALRPRAVHILAGTNDLAGNTGPSSPADYRNNVRAMATLARANGIAVLLASIPPVDRFAWQPTLNPAPMLTQLNSWLKAYAADEGLRHLDYHAAMAARDGSMRADLTYDGVHPNRAGYAVMAPIARAALAQL